MTTAKPVVPRERARRDVDAAVDWYPREAGERVALDFIDRLEGAFRAIADFPARGSTRYAHELNLPGLRGQAVERYPHIVFYLERDDLIDVWRVLHASRDIPARMRDPQTE